MESLFADVKTVRRFITIEDNIVECAVSGTVINDLNKYRKTLTTNYTSACRGC